MNYVSLATLVDSEPDNASRTAAEVAAWCNGDSGTPRLIPFDLTPTRIGSTIGALRAATVIAEMEAVDAAHARMASWIEGPHMVSAGDTETRAFLDTLAAGDDVSLTTEEADAIKALGEEPQTRAQAAGIGLTVKPGHIASARSL